MKIKTQCACVDENNTIWVFSDDFNGLFRYDLEQDELIYVNTNHRENFHTAQLYNGAVYYDGNIFFFPIYASGIAVYNINANEFDLIELPKRSGTIYYNIVRMDAEKILLFPIVFSKYSYVLDMKNKTVIVKTLDIHRNDLPLRKDSIAIGTAIIEDKAYFALVNSKNIIEYNLEKNEIEIFEISCDAGLFCVKNKGENLYCMNTVGTKIYIVNRDKIVKTISLDNNGASRGRNYVGFMIMNQENILCNPGIDDYFLLIGKNDERKYIKLNKGLSEESVIPFISCVIELDHYLIGIPYNGSYGFVYNNCNDDNKKLEFRIGETNMEHIISKLFEDGEHIIQEGTILELVDFVNYICREKEI